MSDYNYLTYSQEQLKKAIELLNHEPNNYTVEAQLALEILAKTKPIYKKAYGTGEFVQVGKLTAKNEIIFDKPLSSPNPVTKNLGRSSNVYYAGWFIFLDVEKIEEGESKREEHLSYYEIANRNMFSEILYHQGSFRDEVDVANTTVLGFMMGDYRNAEVVFYDQYIE
jgi:hypothetical protein